MVPDSFILGRFYRRKASPPDNAVFLCCRDDTPGGLGRRVFVDLREFRVIDAARADPDWFEEVEAP